MPITRQPHRFLDLRRIRFPVNALLSISHRVSGMGLVLLLPLPIYLFDSAVHSPQGFNAAQALLAQGWVRLALTLFLWGLLHHLASGLRCLLIDLDIGVELKSALGSARALLWLSPLLLLFSAWVVCA